MVLSIALCNVTVAQQVAKPSEFDTLVKPFFKVYCIKCHGPSKTKGEISLNTLAGDFATGDEIVHWNSILDMLDFGEMPPINDMYNYVKSFMDMDKPASHGVDPFFFDRKPIHEPIHKHIIQELGLDAASND